MADNIENIGGVDIETTDVPVNVPSREVQPAEVVEPDAGALEPTPDEPSPEVDTEEQVPDEARVSEEELLKDIDDLLRSQPTGTGYTPPVGTPEPSDEDLEDLWRDNPQTATQKIVQRELARARAQAAEEVRQQQAIKEQAKVRDEANKSVWLKHPEVLKVDKLRLAGKMEEYEALRARTPFYQAIEKVYGENPYLAHVPNGPALAMKLAEAETGMVANDAINQVKENYRQEHVQTSSLMTSQGGSRIVKPKKPVNLTDAQKLVARKMRISEEEYARNIR